MKNIRFLSENFQFLEVKFSIYLNRRVFVMLCRFYCYINCSKGVGQVLTTLVMALPLLMGT